MGCGGSKNVDVVAQEGARPSTPPGTNVKVVQAADQQQQQQKGNQSPGKNVQPIITESTADGESIAAKNMNPQANLAVAGRGVDSNRLSVDVGDDDDESHRLASATSTRSAPSIMQRPSSRGGSAFEIQFDDDAGQRRMPRRLEKLQHQQRARKHKDLTLDQLQRKLEAAERRKKDYESKIKEKMAALGSRPTGDDTGEKSHETAKKLEQEANKAEEKRQKQLDQLRQRMKEKEEHARKVRERAAKEKENQAKNEA